MSVPYTFANQAGPIPLAELDANFAALGVSVGNGVSMVGAGADGTGGIDCATVLATVFAALPAGGMIVFDAGKTFLLSTVTLNGKACTIYAEGATINCDSASGAISKTDHVGPLKIIGGNWVATSTYTCVNYTATPPSGPIYYDLLISRATFTSNAAFAVYLSGASMVMIRDSYFISTLSSGSSFTAGGGLYLTAVNGPVIDGCFFKGANGGSGIYAQGLSNNASGGFNLRNSQVLTFWSCVCVSAWQDMKIESNTIAFGLGHNLRIENQQGGSITNNYIQGSSGSNVAALEITSAGNTTGAQQFCTDIRVAHNQIDGLWYLGTTPDNTFNCITIDEGGHGVSYCPQRIRVEFNTISYFTKYGINFLMNQERLLIFGNTFDQAPTYGLKPIYNANGSGGDLGVLIAYNQLNQNNPTTVSNPAGCQFSQASFFNNSGYLDFGLNTNACSISMLQNGNTGIGSLEGGYSPAGYWHWMNMTGPILADRYANVPTFQFRRANGTIAAPTTTISGDVCGNVYFNGWNGAAYKTVAGYSASAAETLDGTHWGGQLDFLVSPHGNGGITPAFEISGGSSGTNGYFAMNPTGNLTAGTNQSIPMILVSQPTNTPASASNPAIYWGTGAPTTTPAQNFAIYYRGDPVSLATCKYYWYSGVWTAAVTP